MAEQYVTIRSLADKLMRHPLMSDLTLEAILDYSIDFLRITGVPKSFEERVSILEVENYRAKLPCDWIQTIQIRKNRGRHKGVAMRYSSDSFHMKPREHGSASVDYTFKIQGNIIYTSFKDGEIEIAYLAIPLDSEGLPYLPDNSKYTRALEYYIRKEYFTILFDMGKIALPILQNAQQQYSFYVGQAQNDLVKLDISKAQSLFNGWSALLPRNHAFEEGFANSGSKEHLRIQNSAYGIR